VIAFPLAVLILAPSSVRTNNRPGSIRLWVISLTVAVAVQLHPPMLKKVQEPAIVEPAVTIKMAELVRSTILNLPAEVTVLTA